MYRVEWSEQAEKSLEKIDRLIAKKIRNKVESELSKDPYNGGEPLKGNLKGQWKYRFSKYRIIYEIKPTKLLIIVIEVSHRREVYN